jgi:DNA polymerase-3 subunit gamma/tau
MLGTIDRDHVVRLVRALASGDAGQLLDTARSLEQFSPDYSQVLEDMAALLTRIALCQIEPSYEGDELFDPAVTAELARAIAAEDVQLYYQTAILGRRDLEFVSDRRTGFQMTLVRMLAFRPAGGAGASAGTQARPGVAPAMPQGVVRPAGAGPIDPVQWARVVGDLDVSGAARQLAANCVLLEHQGNTVRLGLDPRSLALNTPANRERLGQALGRYLGGAAKLEIEAGALPAETPSQHVERRSAESLEAARRSLEDDPKVREMKTRFGATLHPESVRPTE